VGGGIRGGVSGPGRRRAGYKGFDRWEYWWEYNKDRFFARRRETVTYGAGPRNQKVDPMEGIRQAFLLPALERAAVDRRPVIRGAALMALGKVGDFEVFRELFRGTADPDRDVRKAAILGLSYMPAPEVALVLERTLLDPREDREVRAFAAGALGLVESPGSTSVLKWALLDRRQSIDVRGAAALALGFYSDANSGKALERILTDRNQDHRLRSMAAGAIGRRADVDGVPILVAALRDKAPDVRRAAALGLGAIEYESKAAQWLQLARRSRLTWNERHELTPEARRALEEDIERFTALAKEEEARFRKIRRGAVRRLAFVAEKDSDLQSRAFALVSLAEIGASECAAPIKKILGRKSHRLKAWAGLAAGVSGNEALAPYLRTALFRKGADPSVRAAMAIGLGLLRDRTVAKDLARTARDVGADPDLRGYSITALALMGDRGADDLLAEVLTTKGNPSLHRNAALALGLTGRIGSGKRLVAIMNGTNDLYVKAAATIALGYLREPSSAEALAKAASDRKLPYLARLYAVLAIGYLGDRSAAPPKLSRLAWHYNYRVSIPAVNWLTSLL